MGRSRGTPLQARDSGGRRARRALGMVSGQASPAPTKEREPRFSVPPKATTARLPPAAGRQKAAATRTKRAGQAAAPTKRNAANVSRALSTGRWPLSLLLHYASQPHRITRIPLQEGFYANSLHPMDR